jgi:hypothetical protein
LLARVYDHVEKKYRRGFRMLTIGWSDGVSPPVKNEPTSPT